MKIHYCTDYDEMSQLSCDAIVSNLKKNQNQLICTATGNSPTATYRNLGVVYNDEPEIFNGMIITKLDEWGGIDSKEPNSCESYIQNKILQPLQIPRDRYISFRSNPISPVKECERVQLKIEQKGPIDICILGLGQNGHIGFNEPANILIPNCHVAELSAESLNHQMIQTMGSTPGYGLTLGMADILQSKKIILLITGSGKKEVIQKLLSKQITTYLPASFLWLHKHTECFIDVNAM